MSHMKVVFEDLQLPAPNIIVENKTIFFTLFNVPSRGINPLYACAYESAAKHNPDVPVVILVDSLSPVSTPPKHLSRKTYPNLHFSRVNLSLVMEDTALESLWDTPKLARSRYRLYDMGDMLRLTVIARFGGVYLDSDIIVLKTLPDQPANYIVAEDEFSVNNAVLSFSKGHSLLLRAIEDLPERFDGETWAGLGPKLLSASVRSLCGLAANDPIENVTCRDFVVLRRNTFYPVSFWNFLLLFMYENNMGNEVMGSLEDSYAVHFFSHILKLDEVKMLRMAPEQPLYKLMREHCPITEKAELRKLIGEHYREILY